MGKTTSQLRVTEIWWQDLSEVCHCPVCGAVTKYKYVQECRYTGHHSCTSCRERQAVKNTDCHKCRTPIYGKPQFRKRKKKYVLCTECAPKYLQRYYGV